MIAVPADHRLADTDEPVDVSVLADEHVLLLEDGHCLRDIRLLRCTAPVPQRRIAMLWRESSVYRDFLTKVAEVARDPPPGLVHLADADDSCELSGAHRLRTGARSRPRSGGHPRGKKNA